MDRQSRTNLGRGTVCTLMFAMIANSTMGAVVPYLESFMVDSANWRDSTGTTILTWNASGGPEGDSFASTTFNFVNSTSIDTPALFRAHDEFGSSGGAFEGHWINDGVESLCAWVRHDAGVPLSFFVRFSGPANFPAAVSVTSPPVPSGRWTKIFVPIPDPNFIFEGPFTFAQVFSNIGHVQIGVSVPAQLAGVNQVYHFGLDRVRITNNAACAPALSTVGMGVLGLFTLGFGALMVRRRTGKEIGLE